MFPSFLPDKVADLTEDTSIALAQKIECQPLDTPLSKDPITTTYIHHGEEGVPYLFLHGFDSSLFEFRSLFPLIAQNQETWMVDLFGFGFTERRTNLPFGTEAIKTHLYHFWQTLIQKPVILVGASMGGATALDFTLTYPQAVEKLVLIDSAGVLKPPPLTKFMFPPMGYLATEFLRNPKVRSGISRSAYYDSSLSNADAELCAALHLEAPYWSQALITFTKSGGYGSFRDRLPEIEQPTLILWGRNDKILGTKDAHSFQDIPRSQLIWIENCGHVPHLEKPSLTAHHILEFVKESLVGIVQE